MVDGCRFVVGGLKDGQATNDTYPPPTQETSASLGPSRVRTHYVLHPIPAFYRDLICVDAVGGIV